MRVIISPAKKMKVDTDTLQALGTPVFLEKTEEVLQRIKELSYEEAKKLWGCSDSLARQNFERFQTMDLKKNLTPAVLSYEGIQYQYMAPAVFETDMLSWIQEHLRILSGFYGVVKPMDGVVPYRLEMQAKLSVGGCKDLYEFWGDAVWQEVCREGCPVLNLASREYSRCVEQYLREEEPWVTCVFGELQGEKVVQKGTYAKMARGEMVRFLAQRQAKRPEEAKEFARLGYCFAPEYSDESTYTFLRQA